MALDVDKRAPLRIWRFLDGKPGHEKQTAGLLQGLEARCSGLSITDIKPSLRFSRQLRARHFLENPPQLLIGAGHAVHIPMLRCKLRYGGSTVVMMKPSLPSTWFDLIIVPQHDWAGGFGNVVQTFGPLAPIAPLQEEKKDRALILIGGPSKHFDWDEQFIVDTIGRIVQTNKQITWEICNSRRTPPTMLEALAPLDVKLHSWDQTEPNFLQSAMASSRYIWVTQDSIAMIYESLAHLALVGVINPDTQPSPRSSRLRKNTQRLIARRYVLSSSQSLDLGTFNPRENPGIENDRCAQIVLSRLAAV